MFYWKENNILNGIIVGWLGCVMMKIRLEIQSSYSTVQCSRMNWSVIRRDLGSLDHSQYSLTYITVTVNCVLISIILFADAPHGCFMTLRFLQPSLPMGKSFSNTSVHMAVKSKAERPQRMQFSGRDWRLASENSTCSLNFDLPLIVSLTILLPWAVVGVALRSRSGVGRSQPCPQSANPSIKWPFINPT